MIDDIHEYKVCFASVDTRSSDSLREWFEKYPYLSTHDFAQIAQKSANTIRRWKKKAGISKGSSGSVRGISIPKISTIVAPNNWDNENWLRQQHRTHSIREIAKATNRHHETIRQKFIKYDIEIKSVKESSKSTNIYYDKNWCQKHYVDYGLSLSECARKASVSRDTFTSWLNRFNIPIRNSEETFGGFVRKNLWVSKLIYNLENQDVVRRIIVRHDHLHVKFMTYASENYFIDKPAKGRYAFAINKENSRLEKIPTISCQYENDMGQSNQYPCHLTIKRSKWNKASVIEQRIASQNFIQLLNNRGWVWPKYPNHILDTELSKMKQYKPSKYINGDCFTVYPRLGGKPAPGRKIIEHYFGLEELSSLLSSPRKTWKAIKNLTNKNYAINTHNLFRIMSALWGPKLFDPVVYAVILQRLKIKGPVLDLHPGYGNRAIACALLGIKYMTIPNDRFDNALNNGFADFINLDYEPYDGRMVNLTIYDKDFKQSDVLEAMEYASSTNKMMVFVPKEQKIEMRQKYQPDYMLQVRTSIYNKEPDYLFVW